MRYAAVMQELGLLYEHAQTVSVRVDGASPITICVSRVPQNGLANGRTRRKLLLLHGNPANMHDFGPLAARLRSEFELLALDLPGFGRSESLPLGGHEPLLQRYARHVHAVLGQLGWTGDYVVLGHSHGGAVAQTLAVMYPEEVAGIVLLATLGTPAQWGYRQLALPGVMVGLRGLVRALALPNPRAVRRRIVRAIMSPIFAPQAVPEAWVDAQLAVIDRRPEVLVNMALISTGDPCLQLGRNAEHIRAPTLFVHGQADRLVPDLYARAIYDRMSKETAEFHLLEGAGHMIQLTHVVAVASLIQQWANRLPQ